MVITFPTNTDETIRAIRGVIGRDIYMNITVTTSGCSLCGYDPVNNASKDPFCSGCGGLYWIPITEDISESGHVRWYPFDEARYEHGGAVFDGDCIVTIAYTSGNLENVRRANYFLVDGMKMTMDKYTLRGVPQLNRIRIFLREDGR